MAYHRAVAAVRVAVYELSRSQTRHVRQTEQRCDSRLAYRISEAAKLTGISESSVVRAIERGELRAVKLNRDTDTSARLILAGDLERWLAGLPER
jgi:excisionase family DNA binding protein